MLNFNTVNFALNCRAQDFDDDHVCERHIRTSSVIFGLQVVITL